MSAIGTLSLFAENKLRALTTEASNTISPTSSCLDALSLIMVAVQTLLLASLVSKTRGMEERNTLHMTFAIFHILSHDTMTFLKHNHYCIGWPILDKCPKSFYVDCRTSVLTRMNTRASYFLACSYVASYVRSISPGPVRMPTTSKVYGH